MKHIMQYSVYGAKCPFCSFYCKILYRRGGYVFACVNHKHLILFKHTYISICDFGYEMRTDINDQTSVFGKFSEVKSLSMLGWNGYHYGHDSSLIVRLNYDFNVNINTFGDKLNKLLKLVVFS